MVADGRGWDMLRVEKLRSAMSANDLSALVVKGKSDPASLSLDEVGILFLVTRERIRELERAAGARGGDT